MVTDGRFDPEALRAFGHAVLSALGVPGDDAALVADSLVQADLWGHSSHGLLRLPWYAARLRSGAMRAVTEPAVLTDTGPLVLLDGRDGLCRFGCSAHADSSAVWVTSSSPGVLTWPASTCSAIRRQRAKCGDALCAANASASA